MGRTTQSREFRREYSQGMANFRARRRAFHRGEFRIDGQISADPVCVTRIKSLAPKGGFRSSPARIRRDLPGNLSRVRRFRCVFTGRQQCAAFVNAPIGRDRRHVTCTVIALRLTPSVEVSTNVLNRTWWLRIALPEQEASDATASRAWACCECLR